LFRETRKLTTRRPNVAAERALPVLADSLIRVMSIPGRQDLEVGGSRFDEGDRLRSAVSFISLKRDWSGSIWALTTSI
jgi:hypothetical protein